MQTQVLGFLPASEGREVYMRHQIIRGHLYSLSRLPSPVVSDFQIVRIDSSFSQGTVLCMQFIVETLLVSHSRLICPLPPHQVGPQVPWILASKIETLWTILLPQSVPSVAAERARFVLPFPCFKESSKQKF